VLKKAILVKVKTKTVKFLSLWAPVIIWVLIIFKLSSGMVPQASSLYWPNFAFMKSAHAFFFGALAILIYRALRGEGLSRKRAAIWALALTIAYGASDEIHQIFTQGREAKVRDVFIDGTGASIVIYLIYKFLPRLPKKIQDLLLQFGIN
jgi:hypothetical protein